MPKRRAYLQEQDIDPGTRRRQECLQAMTSGLQNRSRDISAAFYGTCKMDCAKNQWPTPHQIPLSKSYNFEPYSNYAPRDSLSGMACASIRSLGMETGHWH